ncbi:M48 family metallopeptidase [Azoarcus olearius]|uniref:M48 family metallopeptidase n=1 Tax=Azoarcus sp. (strain BH72) TaxID=418699 RepID=UPI001E2D99EB|nr:SprT family zinc-dependent metalloprotease [Azoarcus olearius]
MGRQTLTRPRTPAVEAAHVVWVDGRRVDLVVRHSARRTLALQVDQRGARVAVPHGTPMPAVERFVAGHGQWLLDRLDARSHTYGAPLAIESGAQIPVLGHLVRLQVGAAFRRVQWCHDVGGEVLQVPEGPRRAASVVRALRVRALAWFGGRVEEYCHRLAVPVPPVRLSSARTRWGSCSRASGIRLHWRLIHLEPALIDYVVAHEVAHLLEMNHSPRFWSVVERIYPGWRAARGLLKKAAATLPHIEPGELLPQPVED